MSRLIVRQSDPREIEVDDTVGPIVRRITVTYSGVSMPFGFRGPNRFPALELIISTVPELIGITFTLFNGLKISLKYTVFQGVVFPLLDPMPPSQGRPLRVVEFAGPFDHKLLIIENDITLNDNNEIIPFDPRNVNSTLVYSFYLDSAYSDGVGAVTITPVLVGDSNNPTDITGAIITKRTFP